MEIKENSKYLIEIIHMCVRNEGEEGHMKLWQSLVGRDQPKKKQKTGKTQTWDCLEKIKKVTREKEST